MSVQNIQQAAVEHFERIHRAALVLTGNPWDADDLTQETFLVATHDAHRFAGRSALSTWLHGILVNLVRRKHRKTGIRARALRILGREDQDRARAEPSAEAILENQEWQQSLWALVAELPRAQQLVLVLRFSQQLSYQEIAEALGCPLGTVKSRIFHGLAALKERMQAANGESRVDSQSAKAAQAGRHLHKEVCRVS